ncbi:MAG: superinfection immunity protein [Nitrospirales bacterium]
MEFFLFALVVLAALALYFLPTGIAVDRKHRNTAPIFLVNLLFGVTLIGWAVALIWAFTDNTRKAHH